MLGSNQELIEGFHHPSTTHKSSVQELGEHSCIKTPQHSSPASLGRENDPKGNLLMCPSPQLLG